MATGSSMNLRCCRPGWYLKLRTVLGLALLSGSPSPPAPACARNAQPRVSRRGCMRAPRVARRVSRLDGDDRLVKVLVHLPLLLAVAHRCRRLLHAKSANREQSAQPLRAPGGQRSLQTQRTPRRHALLRYAQGAPWRVRQPARARAGERGAAAVAHRTRRCSAAPRPPARSKPGAGERRCARSETSPPPRSAAWRHAAERPAWGASSPPARQARRRLLTRRADAHTHAGNGGGAGAVWQIPHARAAPKACLAARTQRSRRPRPVYDGGDRRPTREGPRPTRWVSAKCRIPAPIGLAGPDFVRRPAPSAVRPPCAALPAALGRPACSAAGAPAVAVRRCGILRERGPSRAVWRSGASS